MRWTSSGQSVRFHPGQNGRCAKIIENSEIGMSRHLDSSYHDTSGQNLGPVWKTQSFLLSGIRTVILLAGLLWERQFEKVLGKTLWGKSSKWRTSICRPRNCTILVFVCGRYKTGWKETEHLSEPTSFLGRVCLGCTQRECQISMDIVDNYKSMWKKLPDAKAPGKPETNTVSSWSYDMEGHAMLAFGTIIDIPGTHDSYVTLCTSSHSPDQV